MIEELLIRGVGVIDEVTLELTPGLIVLTGETGAGKTMVVSALEMLLGSRADADLIRTGVDVALVEGRLRPPPDGSEQWLGEGDADLIVSRELLAGDVGTRSRARMQGRLAPASALAATVGSEVEIHGQSESVRLGDPAIQRALLDRFGGPELTAMAAEYRATYRSWREAESALEELRSRAQERAREQDRLRYELSEIDAVAPTAGENEELAAQLPRLEHAEALGTAATQAAEAITGDGGARDRLGAALGVLRAQAGVDADLDALAERLSAAAVEAQEVGLDLVGYAEQVQPDPQRLEALRERRAALHGLTRKYGADLGAVLAYADEARARLESLGSGEARVAELTAQVAELGERSATLGAELRKAREHTGTQLIASVLGHLEELALAGARMEVRVQEASPGPDGADRVVFLLAANPGEQLLPVAKAASGGERSRIALALRLALADADATPVVVFDEVDAGIGGKVALAVGEKLARLAHSVSGRQVICVTHLAQLAAFADTHFSVAKEAEGSRTVARVRRVEDEQRIGELARMLSGATDSSMAASHAAELRAAALAALAGD